MFLAKARAGDSELVFKDAAISEVLEVFSRLTGYNLFLDDTVPDNRVTFFVRDLPVKDGFEVFLQSQKLMKREVADRTYIIFPFDQLVHYQGEEISRIVKLDFDDPEKVAVMIRAVYQDLKITVNQRAHAVVLRGSQDLVQQAENDIRELDFNRPQAIVDVKLLEIKRNELKRLGIELDDRSFSNTQLWSYRKKTLPLLLNLADDRGASEILAQPRLRLIEGAKAAIQVGDRIPIEITTTSQTSAGDNINLNKNVQWESVGIKLELELLKIHDSGELTVSVFNEVSTVLSYTTQGYPHIRTRNAKTDIRLMDAETVILGGLINTEERHIDSNIPIFSKLPLVGKLFRDKKTEMIDSEIVMFITPVLLNDSGEVEPELEFGSEQEQEQEQDLAELFEQMEFQAVPSDSSSEPAVESNRNTFPSRFRRR